MGGNTETSNNPVFRAKAVGAFKQKEGCPDYSSTNISDQEIERICKNECYNPSDERKIISRIEVIKVTPQTFEGENVDNLISDPWRVFACEPSQQGCEVEFSDEEFNSDARDASYYVRAIQEPSPAVNAGNLRCTYDDEGNCVEVNICYGDNRTSRDDDCLVMSEERAWSSPIYLNYYNL